MAVKIQEPEISPKKALDNIRERLYAAVDNGKRKAGVLPKTEAVLEATNDGIDFSQMTSGNDRNDEIDFSQMTSGNDRNDEIDFSQMTSGNDRNDEIDFSQMSSSVPDAKALPKTFAIKKPKKMSKEEKLASEKRSNELKKQMNADWNFSVREIKNIVNGLFKYAAENHAYLNDAGPLITESELWAIFYAEYMNYGSDSLKDSTKAALAIIPDMVKKEMPKLLERFDERLHGRGNFLENGSIMAYMLRLGHREVVHTATADTAQNLIVEGDNGLHNFVIKDDLDECEEWVESKTEGFDMPQSARRGLALDILVNGLSKPEMKKRVGGKGSKEYSVPKYGSVQRLGEDLCVLGSERFITDFIGYFKAYLKTTDGDYDPSTIIEPALDENGKEIGRGLLMVRYPEIPYLGLLNDAVASGRFIPVKFGVGSTSLDADNAEKGDGSRRSDVLQMHQLKDTVDSNDYHVGEQMSTHDLMVAMSKPGFTRLAERLGLDDMLKETVGNGGASAMTDLTRLTSSILDKVCKLVGVQSKVSSTHSIWVVDMDIDRSLPVMAGKIMGLTPPEQSALLAVVTFNGFLTDRVTTIKKGHDVSDIGEMSPIELKTETMPSIFTGKLAEVCLTGEWNEPSVVDFAKGYLLNALGSVVGLDDSDSQIFSSAADYCSAIGIPTIVGPVIKTEIKSLTADELPAYAAKFEEKASGNIDEDDEGGHSASFYDESRSIELSKLPESDIVRAIDEVSKDGTEVIKRAAEYVTGLPHGMLDRYLDAIDGGDRDAVEELAREIMRSGRGIVTVKLTDTGAEKVSANKLRTSKQAEEAERRKARRKARREMWF